MGSFYFIHTIINANQCVHLGAGARKKETGCEFGCNSVRFIAFSCIGETKRGSFHQVQNKQDIHRRDVKGL